MVHTIVLEIAGEEEIAIKDLYYVLMQANVGNVKQCKAMIRHGRVEVNHHVVKDVCFGVDKRDEIVIDHRQRVEYPFAYYMLNKPKGYLCAKRDQQYPCVNELIDRDDCYCLGRLDKDTTGLLLMTNDASLSKKLLLPHRHVYKTYMVTVEKILTDDYIEMFKDGVVIDKNVKCQSAYLKILDDYHCLVSICEGKYHQIKKMFLSCHNCVIDLKRIEFGNVKLDEYLQEGEYRLLSEDEIKYLEEGMKR